MHQKKCCEEKHVHLLLIGEEGERRYVLIKDFNTFMDDHTLHPGTEHFCCCCFQTFRTTEKLKCHIKDCFKINFKQKIKMLKEGEYVRFKNYERKIKSLFIIHADFERILVYNGKQNPNEPYLSKHSGRVA